MARSRLRTALTHAVGSGRITAKVVGVMERSVNVTLPNGAHMSNVPMIGGPAVIGQPVSIVKIEGETFALVAGIGQAADARAATISTIVRSNSSEVSDAADGGFDWNKIYVLQGDGTAKSDFESTEAGLSDAITLANSGDIIFLPPRTIELSSSITIPTYVTLLGLDRYKTLLKIETADTEGVSLSLGSSLVNLGVSYKNTAAAGSLICRIIRGYVGNSSIVREIKDVFISGRTTNQQAVMYGIQAEFSYNDVDDSQFAKTRQAVINNVDIDIQAKVDNIYGAYVYTPYYNYKETYIVDLTARVYNYKSSGTAHAKGIVVSTHGLSEAKWILKRCHGYAEPGGITSSGYGIYVQNSADLYDCIGYGKRGYGIFVNYSSRLFGCYGYSFTSTYNNYGIRARCDNGVTMLLLDCHGSAENTGTGTGYGMIVEGNYGDSGDCQIIGGVASGDIDLRVTYNDVHVHGLQYSTTSFYDEGALYPLPGDRDAAHVQAVTADKTLDLADYTTVVDASSNNVTITLPPSATSKNKRYTIKRKDSSSYTVTIDGNGSETIDDQTTQTLAQYDALRIECDGTEWWIT